MPTPSHTAPVLGKHSVNAYLLLSVSALTDHGDLVAGDLVAAPFPGLRQRTPQPRAGRSLGCRRATTARSPRGPGASADQERTRGMITA
ncbi:hypothetical protein SSOG_00135 [Streptomyces himastatinicus ATCC 53653]|uniref:Uncharacterized protein n=1 Tax=Streptomyces himastatinicus ATCC 53653 TaxID=457427 RepID=D9W667_9ACTN|nr:hypothetical protein SSOG_00135 [Streptomyces himastatinicus ATCC 53653]